jgi:hypothetical protein
MGFGDTWDRDLTGTKEALQGVLALALQTDAGFGNVKCHAAR